MCHCHQPCLRSYHFRFDSFVCHQPIKTSPSVGTFQSSRSVALAKRIAALGTRMVLSSLRQHYWIIKGCSAVRRVLNKCFQCKKLEDPRGHLTEKKIDNRRTAIQLHRCDFDYFGTLVVRQGCLNVKCYGCPFTCLVIRAVHTGGFWERIIRSTHKILRALLGQQVILTRCCKH